jgi:hypothetical protein
MLSTPITAARIKHTIPQMSRDLFMLISLLPAGCRSRAALPANENRPIDGQYIDRAGEPSSHRRGDLALTPALLMLKAEGAASCRHLRRTLLELALQQER